MDFATLQDYAARMLTDDRLYPAPLVAAILAAKPARRMSADEAIAWLRAGAYPAQSTALP